MTVTLVDRLFRDIAKCPGILRKKNVPILVKRGDRELWQRMGGSYSNRGRTISVAGDVVLVAEADKEWRHAYSHGKVVLNNDSARVTAKKLAEWAAAIDTFFGVPVAHLIAAGKTVLVTEGDASASETHAVVPTPSGRGDRARRSG